MTKIDLTELFTDKAVVSKIQNKLPKLFRIAEIETSRSGKIGMEVGFLREKVISSLLIYKFGEENVNTNIPETEPETDVKVGNREISIKTITGNGRVKAVWTVEAESSKRFIENYEPKCDIILVRIWWEKTKDSFFLIPLDVQIQIFKLLGHNKYLNMPKAGTNPRGVEFSKEALERMLSHKDTMRIPIRWVKDEIKYDVFKRWVDMWNED
jgi:hypothetical protein